MKNLECNPGSVDLGKTVSKQAEIANWANELRKQDSRMSLSQAITLGAEFVLAKDLKSMGSSTLPHCELP